MTAYVDGRPYCVGCARRFASHAALDKHLTDGLCMTATDQHMREIGLRNLGTYWVLRTRLGKQEEAQA